MRLSRLTICLALLFASNANAISRKEWLASIKRTTPATMCDPRHYGGCFEATKDVCVAKTRVELTFCLDANDKLVTPQLSAIDATRVARKVMSCTGKRLSEKVPLKKSAAAKCVELANTPTR